MNFGRQIKTGRTSSTAAPEDPLCEYVRSPNGSCRFPRRQLSSVPAQLCSRMMLNKAFTNGRSGTQGGATGCCRWSEHSLLCIGDEPLGALLICGQSAAAKVQCQVHLTAPWSLYTGTCAHAVKHLEKRLSTSCLPAVTPFWVLGVHLVAFLWPHSMLPFSIMEEISYLLVIMSVVWYLSCAASQSENIKLARDVKYCCLCPH